MTKIFKKYQKIKKSILSLIIISIFIPAIFLSFGLNQISAQEPTSIPVQDPGLRIKAVEESVWRKIIKEAAMVVARRIINKMTQDTINWINSGFHGNPFFLENPDSFFKDIIKFEVKKLVDIYAYNKAKFPFGKQFALNTINSYKRQLEDNAAYTLSNIIQDQVYLESYRNDFNVGGWSGFLINTQYPQNNYIGSNMVMTEQLLRKLDGTTTNAAQKVQDTLQKGQGFLSAKLCLDTLPNGKPTGYNNGKNEFLQPSFDIADYNKKNPNNCSGLGSSLARAACEAQWVANFEKAKATWSGTNTCKNLAVTTPGGVIGNQVKTALESRFKQTELATAMGSSISAIFDALLNQLMDKAGKGLKGLYGRAPDAPAGKLTQNDTNGIAGGGGPNVPGGPGGPGGNGQCIVAEGVSAYDVYVNAVLDAESAAGYPAESSLPANITPAQAQAAVCAAYKGPGTCSPATQDDELFINGLPAPYVSLSIDFLKDNPYKFWAHAVTACEAGVQGPNEPTPNNCIDPNNIGQCIKIPLEEKIIAPDMCWNWCIGAGGGQLSGNAGNCVFECTLGNFEAETEKINRDVCLQRCTKGGGNQTGCSSSCSSPYYDLGGGGGTKNNPPPPQE